jgi:Na+:H+ antiporter, NhaC family
MRKRREIKFIHCLLPIISLLLLLIYGLIIHPQIFHQSSFPLEIIFLLAATVSICELFYLGFTWDEIQKAMVKKLAQALPAIFILFSIGIIIGSWIVSGTIPMMIYYGIKIINPNYMYIVAFIVPAIFSTLTGTSWGSIGTIGVVILSIAGVVEANLALTAGAIVGGAYLGDKMSPLSDTTNIAALATDVNLYEHIRSMMNTTLPAAVCAAVIYIILGFVYTPTLVTGDTSAIQPTLNALESIFNFNIVLLLPILVVLYGALTKKPTVPTLLGSSFCAAILAFIFQKFSLSSIVVTINKGFDISMITWTDNLPSNIITILNRGGLYNLIDPIVICIMIFLFIGTLELTNALAVVVERTFRSVKTRRAAILSALGSTAITNAMTSNQFATSFLIGSAFRPKFEKLRIPRKVLSRSLEDTGTMLENMLPWTTTGVFIATTLGISATEYWHWQFIALFNYAFAALWAITGIGCFYHEVDGKKEKKKV